MCVREEGVRVLLLCVCCCCVLLMCVVLCVCVCCCVVVCGVLCACVCMWCECVCGEEEERRWVVGGRVCVVLCIIVCNEFQQHVRVQTWFYTFCHSCQF